MSYALSQTDGLYKLGKTKDSTVSLIVLTALAALVLGCALGALGYRARAAGLAKNKRRIPLKWQLESRPLFTDAERKTWQWLKRAFFDHHVLVKIPVIRFLLPQSASQDLHQHELLKGVYCSFTICTTDGTVIGCVDVPGAHGLKASHRDIKQKLFAECGIAYVMISADSLPTKEMIRDAFLGVFEFSDAPYTDSVSPASSPSALRALLKELEPEHVSAETEPDTMRAANGAPLSSLPSPVSSPTLVTADSPPKQASPVMATAKITTPEQASQHVATARNSLQSKLEENRKSRQAKIDSLNASMGIIEDNADQNFVVQWDDSFILENAQKLPNLPAAVKA